MPVAESIHSRITLRRIVSAMVVGGFILHRNSNGFYVWEFGHASRWRIKLRSAKSYFQFSGDTRRLLEDHVTEKAQSLAYDGEAILKKRQNLVPTEWHSCNRLSFMVKNF
jgi:hypothetical protein